MRNAQLLLNKYLPIKQIGSGGFGTVYVCKDMLMQRLVAIKKIELDELDAQRASWVHSDINRDAQVDALLAFETGNATINLLSSNKAHFSNKATSSNEDNSESEEDSLAHSLERRYLANVPGLDEARMAAALSDAAIVAMYDCQIAGNVVYLVMEYVEGTTLTQILADHNEDITLDMIACVFERVSHALAVAHKHGVLHFDIKPDNVLIDAHGNVKVTDFGLATLSDAQGQGSAAAGTIGYMPLEQMRQEALDARTDEWALASIVYEMLAGENPFFAPSLEQAMQCIDGAELTLPSYCWDDVSEELDDVLFKALDPQKEERYETVAEFASELKPLLGDAMLGKRELAACVQGGCVDDVLNENEEADEDADSAAEAGAPARARRGVMGALGSFFSRLRAGFSPTVTNVCARACAAAQAAALGALGTSNIAALSGVENPLFWLFVVGCAALGAIVPSVGALVSLVMVSAALLAHNAPVVGMLVLFAAAAWWWFVGRESKAATNGLLSFPLFSSVGLAPASALFTGYTTRVVPALVTTLFGCFLCVVFASLGSLDITNWGLATHATFSANALPVALNAHDVAESTVSAVSSLQTEGETTSVILANMQTVLARTSTWTMCISWLLAAVVNSVCARTDKRACAVGGAVISFALILAGMWLGCALDAGGALGTATSAAQSAAAAAAGVSATASAAAGVSAAVPSTQLLISAATSSVLMLFATLALPVPKR